MFAKLNALHARATCMAQWLHLRLGELERDTRGSTAIEYAVMAAGVGFAGTGAAAFLGGEVTELFNALQNGLCLETRNFCILK